MRGLRRERRPSQRLQVTDGRVQCPRTPTGVDVDRCLACPSFSTMEKADGTTYVACQPVSVGGVSLPRYGWF